MFITVAARSFEGRDENSEAGGSRFRCELRQLVMLPPTSDIRKRARRDVEAFLGARASRGGHRIGSENGVLQELAQASICNYDIIILLSCLLLVLRNSAFRDIIVGIGIVGVLWYSTTV